MQEDHSQREGYKFIKGLFIKLHSDGAFQDFFFFFFLMWHIIVPINYILYTEIPVKENGLGSQYAHTFPAAS